MLEVIPALAAPKGGGGGGGGGAAELLMTETGDPQTVQKAEPAEMTDPHLGHAAITPPKNYRICVELDTGIAQNEFYYKQLHAETK
jgi:hypothetical protein